MMHKIMRVEKPPSGNRLVEVVSELPLPHTKNESLGLLIGLSVSLIPTFKTLLALPHEFLHVFFSLLSTPRMVFHGLVLAKEADPFGIIGKVFPFIETASREFDIPRQTADFDFSMLSEPVRPLYMSPELASILSSYVPSIFDAVLAFSIMRIGLRAKEGMARWFFLGIGFMKLDGILNYILLNAIDSTYPGDFEGGVFAILHALFGVNFGILDGMKFVSFIPQPWIVFLILSSGIGTVFLGYVIFKSINNLIDLLRKRASFPAYNILEKLKRFLGRHNI